jgi:hypothetical protein
MYPRVSSRALLERNGNRKLRSIALLDNASLLIGNVSEAFTSSKTLLDDVVVSSLTESMLENTITMKWESHIQRFEDWLDGSLRHLIWTKTCQRCQLLQSWY